MDSVFLMEKGSDYAVWITVFTTLNTDKRQKRGELSEEIRKKEFQSIVKGKGTKPYTS